MKKSSLGFKIIFGLLFVFMLAPQGFAKQGVSKPKKHSNSKASPQKRSYKKVELWQRFLGPPTAFYIGFGSGQGVQGRFRNTGAKVMAWELGGLAVAGVGILPCALFSTNQDKNSKLKACSILGIGMIIFFGTRLYSVYDTIVGPYHHNARLRQTKSGYRERSKKIFRTSWNGIQPIITPGETLQKTSYGLSVHITLN